MDAFSPRLLTRRDALAAGLAAAGALTLGRFAGAADTPADSPYGPFRMGLQSYSLRHFKLDDALAKTKELGLHYWESFPAHIPADVSKADAMRKKAESYDVKVTGFGVVGFGKDMDANRKLFEFGKAIGLSYISCDPSPDSFDNLDKLTEEYGIPVGIHNHGPGHKWAKIDDIMAAIKDHSPKIGCCIDTGHFLRSKEDPVRAVEVFDKRIYGVHLKDVKNATEFKILGEGDLRLTELLKQLAKRKYNYNLALEYEESEAMPMDDIRACLKAEKKAAEGL
ncbi:MAG: sugar phosphate isomerase/epimerase [Planctomycetota bacterium]|nr:sugar phosphate isomerase/epimerase [Planctomycetota bacterium]